jgi:flagellar assembly factor FliW
MAYCGLDFADHHQDQESKPELQNSDGVERDLIRGFKEEKTCLIFRLAYTGFMNTQQCFELVIVQPILFQNDYAFNAQRQITKYPK